MSWAEALIAVSHEDSENGRPYPKLCDLAIERFTCLGVFPLCAAVEVPVAPFPTCDHACLQLQALCGPKVGQIVACGQSAQGTAILLLPTNQALIARVLIFILILILILIL